MGKHLESTLNRVQKNFPVAIYHWIIKSIKSVVESYTSKRWNLSESDKVVIKEINSYYRLPQGDCEFMAHLRHTSFPSPFLDWTRSPYVAAFFAFNEDKKTDSAIFMYLEYTNAGKISDQRARIDSVGPEITTHKRHHLQQSEYTYCVREINNTLYYTSHEDAFSVNETESKWNPSYLNQDLLKKYTIPYSQRANFLSKLNLMNINAYSLFETEEGLMSKLAIEKFLIENI